jgi:hypothetical protein
LKVRFLPRSPFFQWLKIARKQLVLQQRRSPHKTLQPWTCSIFIRQDFADDRTFRPYDENILKRAGELLDFDDPDIGDYLDNTQHLWWMNHQTLFVERATLIETLITKLVEDCGVTVLWDEAQLFIHSASMKNRESVDTTTLPERHRKKSFTFDACKLEIQPNRQRFAIEDI